MKALIIALTLVGLFNSAPPTLDEAGGVGFAQCPDDSVVMLELHNSGAGVAVYRQGSESPYAFVDRQHREVYVYGFKKWYAVEEAVEQWPSLCDIPGGTGV